MSISLPPGQGSPEQGWPIPVGHEQTSLQDELEVAKALADAASALEAAAGLLAEAIDAFEAADMELVDARADYNARKQELFNLMNG